MLLQNPKEKIDVWSVLEMKTEVANAFFVLVCISITVGILNWSLQLTNTKTLLIEHKSIRVEWKYHYGQYQTFVQVRTRGTRIQTYSLFQ